MSLNVGTLVANLELDSSKFEKNIDKSKQKSEEFAGKLNSAVKVGLLAVASGFVALGAASYKAWTVIDSAYDNIRSGTGATGDDLALLRGSFDTVFTNVPGDAADVSDAISTLNTKLGVTGVNLEEISTQMINLGRITGTDVKTNLDSLTDVFNNWSIATEDVADKTDYLYKISQRTDVPVSELANTMKSYGPLLRSLGYDFEGAAALVGGLGKSGFDTNTIMSGLKMSMNNFDMSSPAEQIKVLDEQIQTIKDNMAVWKAVAVDSGDWDRYDQQVADATTQLEDLEYQLRVVKKANEGNTETQKSFADAWKDTLVELKNAETQTERVAIATDLTSRAGIDLAGAFEKGAFTGGLEELQTAAQDSADSINNVATETADLEEDLKILGQNAMLALAPVGEAMDGVVRGITPELTEDLEVIAEILPEVITGFFDLNNTINEGIDEGTVKFWNSISDAIKRFSGETENAGIVVEVFNGIVKYNTTLLNLWYDAMAAAVGVLSSLAVGDWHSAGLATVGFGQDIAGVAMDTQNAAYGAYEDILGVDMPEFNTTAVGGAMQNFLDIPIGPQTAPEGIKLSPGATVVNNNSPIVNVYAQTNATKEEIAMVASREVGRLSAGGFGI